MNRRVALGVSLALVGLACEPREDAPEPETPPQPIAAPPAAPAAPAGSLLDAADRSAADKALDAGRKPLELLAFAGVRPGMRVAELEAGGGYTAEILARAVGPTGVVYAQNDKFVLERFAAKPWSERLAKPVMRHVVRVDRELDDPLPPEARDLDVVFLVLFYHDTYWLGVDQGKLNHAVHAALKPGGLYVIVDHSGRAGTGTTEVKTLHRIEEAVVKADLQKAGFRLAGEADFLRNPGDARDWNASPGAAAERRGTSDRFVLKLQK